MTTLDYKQSGVDIDTANATKKQMAASLETNDSRVLNKIGAFASLFDGSFPLLKEPILVFKTEEPGSKQKLAFKYGRVASICEDLINHLINDIAVMGAYPLSVQDCIICGKMEKDVILQMVEAFSQACKANECVLTGGETSEQPGVLEAGTYVLTASVTGIVEKSKIIDGSRIEAGDVVLALPSSGVHTNGFTLVRKIIEMQPEILKETVDGAPFIDAILTPHRSYFKVLKRIFELDGLTGLAHITGGGIRENLDRILPQNLNAEIDISRLQILPVFKTLKQFGNLADADMMRTFNMGVGITAVCRADSSDEIIRLLKEENLECYPIGKITEGEKKVELLGELSW
ncbi:MAG: phosphoribosylformylglycinamidine cyclo-ligase [Bacteroidota bacterium]